MTWPRRLAIWLLAILVAALATLLALDKLWVIRSVQVTGNHFLSKAAVEQISGVHPGTPWLWITPQSLQHLKTDPWIASARVVKIFPSTVRIAVKERSAVAQLRYQGKLVEIDGHGVVLPGAPLRGPLIQGWGPSRVRSALAILTLLRRDHVQVVNFDPVGFSVHTQLGTIWTDSLPALARYAAIASQYTGAQVNIYPWGVSVQ